MTVKQSIDTAITILDSGARLVKDIALGLLGVLILKFRAKSKH